MEILVLLIIASAWYWHRGRKERARERFVRQMTQGRVKAAAEELQKLLS